MLKVTDECTACGACLSICPKSCISFKSNEEGFLYPHIDIEKCVDCDLCSKVCFLNDHITPTFRENDISYYAAKAIERCNLSSSGGIFPLLAESVLKNGGVVIGAAWDDKFNVKHILIKSKSELPLLCGSKYIQSNTEKVFKIVKEHLSIQTVLFSGTPCQVKGLKTFLGKDYDNLITVELVCHGVPSPLVFRRYLNGVLKYNNLDISQCSKINFREVKDDIYRFVIYNKTKIPFYEQYTNLYTKTFLQNLFLRNSCYNCKCKLENSVGDFILGDFWGCRDFYPEFYDPKGVSLVIVCTERAKKIWLNLKLSRIEVKKKIVFRSNRHLLKSASYNRNRDLFFKTFIHEAEISLDDILMGYTNKDIWVKVKCLIISVLRFVGLFQLVQLYRK